MTHSKLVRISKKGQFVLPKDIRDALGLAEGDTLLVTLEGQRILLLRPEQFASQTRGLLQGTWHKGGEPEAYLEKERESWD